MRSSLSFLKPILALTLASTLTAGPLLSVAADESSNLTKGLNTAAGALNGVNSLMGEITKSQQNLQGLVNQLALQGANLTGQLGQFDQIRMKLANAMTDVNTCVNKERGDTSKYKKASIGTADLLGTEPNCLNYGKTIDSIRKNRTELDAASAKMGCLTKFQNEVDRIADEAKQPFVQHTSAANEVWNTRDQIIKTYEKMAERIKNEVDGENGYRSKVAELNNIALGLNQMIDGLNKGEGGNATPGYALRVKALKRNRAQVANSWYSGLLQQTQSCFESQPAPCFGNGAMGSAAQCVAAYVANPDGSSTPGARSRGKANTAALNNLNIKNYGALSGINLPADLDAKNPGQVATFFTNQFSKVVNEVTRNFASMPFFGNVNKAAITEFVRQRYKACYESSIKQFVAGLGSDAGHLRGGITAQDGNKVVLGLNDINDQEIILATELKTEVEHVQQKLNSFQTAFNKVYNVELPQFASNCTAGDDPYENLNCLKIIQANLKTALSGTEQFTTLENGQRYKASPQAISMNIQTMGLDAQGKPTINNQTVQCTGFEGCIQHLDTYRSTYEGQVESQTQEREKFVEDHNKAVDATMSAVAQVFNQAGGLVAAAVGGINEDLKNAGIPGAVLKTKAAEAEALVKNEKTGLYDAPTNMKGALAANTSYTEIDTESATDVNKTWQDRKRELNELEKKAKIAKGKCTVSESDYEGIVKNLECNSICKSDNLSDLVRPLEKLLYKSKSTPPADGENREISDNFERCMERAEDRAANRGRDSRSSENDTLAAALALSRGENAASNQVSQEEALKRREAARAQEKRWEAEDLKSDRGRCEAALTRSLHQHATESRGVLKENNEKLIRGLQNINRACASASTDTDSGFAEEAVEACEALQSDAKRMTGPSDEAETNIDSKDETSGSGNVLRAQ